MNASIINICNDDLQDVEYMYILYSKKWTGVVVIQAKLDEGYAIPLLNREKVNTQLCQWLNI